ncbi:MAG TPA: hypothetical protein VFN31_00850 [Candidatus Saccharimonadales bacterium]|nr:hypothetical protein [Candidatus Saccharimonadales bacterium]
MNSDTPPSDNAISNGPQNQPQRPEEAGRPVRSIDSFQRPSRPNMSTAPQPRPRQDIAFAPRSNYSQSIPQRPVRDIDFVSPSAPPRPMTPQPQQQPAPRPIQSPNYEPRGHEHQPPISSPSTPNSYAVPQPTPAQHQAPVAPIANKESTSNPVKIFSIVMIVLSTISLATWIIIGLKTDEEIIGSVLSLLELGLATAMLKKAKLTRVPLLIVASLTLIFALFSSVSYIHQHNSVSHISSPELTGIKQAIQTYQNDNSLSDAQRAKDLQSLEHSESVIEQQQVSLNEVGKAIVPLRNIVIAYLVAFIPIVFLTRPKIKHRLV